LTTHRGSLLIRADADTRMGTGHVMRCLALAQAWQDSGGIVEFLTACDVPNILARLRTEDVRVTPLASAAGSEADAAETAARARESGAAWAVVDGYQFSSAYQRSLKRAGVKILWVDDYGHATPYSADVILNQNLYPSEALYAQRDPGVLLLLGPRYAMLRREFTRWRGRRREVPERATKLLITMGGADAENTTAKFVTAVRALERPELEVKVVVGPASPQVEQVEGLCTAAGACFRAICAGSDMPELMRWADVAVAAAGSTALELLFMGLPAALVMQSDNQQRVAEALAAEGLAVNLGRSEQLESAKITEVVHALLDSRERRVKMSEDGRGQVDGLGAARVLVAMGGRPLVLRRAVADDCERLWKWKNEPAVRAISFTTDEVPWEAHVKWFEARLVDPGCLFYVAENLEGEAVGQVRYDVNGRDATISITVAPTARGMGYGTRLIRQASATAVKEAGIARVHAYVKPGNEVSVGAFLKAGYKEAEPETVRGQQALHFVLQAKSVSQEAH
jgi:UDP-2,4-diacetamido-2,4,6-trideoxy-beta-L-altropyranose hydrolase